MTAPQLPSPPLGETTNRYSKGTDSLRTTAKWMLATFAATGAVLIAGIQLTKLGSLEGDLARLFVAIAGLAVGLTAAGYMIHQTAKVLTDDWVTLAELSNESIDAELASRPDKARLKTLNQLNQKIELNRQELFYNVADSISALHRAVREANIAAQEIGQSRTTPSERTLWAVARAEYLRYVAGQVTDFANYYRTLMIFRSLKRRLAVAATCVVLAVGLVAYSTNPPEPSSITKVELVTPS